MKRFLAFAGADYYPGGGWRDFVGGFGSVADAITAIDRIESWMRRWWHVVDVETLEIVARGVCDD